MRVLHKENGGVSSARNLGMAEAKGNYLAFADSDDWLPPDALELMYQALKEKRKRHTKPFRTSPGLPRRWPSRRSTIPSRISSGP